jgi:serine/threonine-protein kinase HipA
MKIGGEDRPRWIIQRRWQQFADEIGVKYKLVKSKLAAMSQRLPVAAIEEAQVFQQHYGDCQTLERIIDLIQKRCQKSLRALTAGE